MTAADLTAMLAELLADPTFLTLICIAVVVCIGLATDQPHDAGDTHTPYRTADGARIEQEAAALRRRADEALRTRWRSECTRVKQPVNNHGHCAPKCFLGACDLEQACARLSHGRKVIPLQRLTTQEQTLIKFAAAEAALEDHARALAERPNPLPRHTRAAALWAVEYAAQRDLLNQVST